MRFMGWVFATLCVFFVIGFFAHWVDVKRSDDHVEFHVLTGKFGNDMHECWEWCGSQCVRINRGK